MDNTFIPIFMLLEINGAVLKPRPKNELIWVVTLQKWIVPDFKSQEMEQFLDLGQKKCLDFSK